MLANERFILLCRRIANYSRSFSVNLFISFSFLWESAFWLCMWVLIERRSNALHQMLGNNFLCTYTLA